MINRRHALSAVGIGLLAACSQEGSSIEKKISEDPSVLDTSKLTAFTLNLESWWYDKPFLERIDLAAKAGFQTAEMWSPVKTGMTISEIASRAKDAGIDIIHSTLDVPKLAAASAGQTRDKVKTSLAQVKELGVKYVTIVGHDNIPGKIYDDMLAPFTDRLAEMAPLLEKANVIGCLEPFNPYNHPAHFLHGSADALKICREINSPNLKINWDLFHMQRAEGNVVHNLRSGLDQCALIQIADSPGRQQPGTGEMNYAYILNAAIEAGFKGPIGLECFPDPSNIDDALKDVTVLGEKLKTV